MHAEIFQRGLDLPEHQRHALGAEDLQGVRGGHAEEIRMLPGHRLGDLADVLARIAVVRRCVLPRRREQGAGESVDLRAGVVEVILRDDLGILRAEDPGQRVTDRSPPHPADVNRSGRVGRDELKVHPLAGQAGPAAVSSALPDSDPGHRGGRRGPQADVQEPAPGHLSALDRRIDGEPVCDRLRQLPRRKARLLRHLKRQRRRIVAVAGIPRPFHARRGGSTDGSRPRSARAAAAAARTASASWPGFTMTGAPVRPADRGSPRRRPRRSARRSAPSASGAHRRAGPRARR